jgi:hypothetical protein
VRPVEWEAKEVAAQVLAKDLRHALGSIMTVFRPGARAAERRLETVVAQGRDPGPDSGGDDRSGAWVFQANPKRFDLLQALDAGSAECRVPFAVASSQVLHTNQGDIAGSRSGRSS